MPLKQYIKSHIIKNNKSHCEINSHEIYNEDVLDIVELLNQQPHVKSLEIGQTNIDDDGIILLSKLLHVTHLTLKRGKFGDDGAIALIRNDQFKSLNFYGNPRLTDITGKVMANESQQIFLDVTDTSIKQECKDKIAEKVARNIVAANLAAANPTTYTQASAPSSPSSSRFFEEKKEGSPKKDGNPYNEILLKAQQDRKEVNIRVSKI